jgi:hypothetical protein
MSDRRLPATQEQVKAARDEAGPRHGPRAGLSGRIARPRSAEEAEERYREAREAWTAAMRAAGSGRPADLSRLAITQEAYETALAEQQRWAAAPRTPIRVDADRPRGIEIVVGQELSWRRVHENESEQPRGIRGLIRRITRR